MVEEKLGGGRVLPTPPGTMVLRVLDRPHIKDDEKVKII